MFEIYYPEDHKRPEDDFAQAEIVVGPHGAALTDIVYCFPGTRVLELIPSDHVYPYFYTLASAAGLEYYCLPGTSTSVRSKSVAGPSPYDFYLDPDEFNAALKFLTHRRDASDFPSM
jgi:capsular polysaccharide biosynthesis protein